VDISISDYIKIKNRIDSSRDIKKEIVNSLSELINYLHKHNIKCKYESYLPLEEEAVNIIYKDHRGSTSQITMLLNESTLTKMQRTVLNNMETKVNDYNYPKITTTMNDSISINLDRTKIIDLLYVYDKINRNIHTMADNNKILLLAKSINLY
jgi:hypothetical protein